MNSYKVTYLLNGEEHYDHITERTEKAAQKRVKGIYKDAEITDTELISTDASATKEQERGTLEVGKYADLVVLDRDPYDRPERIGEARVLATVSEGRTVYQNSCAVF